MFTTIFYYQATFDVDRIITYQTYAGDNRCEHVSLHACTVFRLNKVPLYYELPALTLITLQIILPNVLYHISDNKPFLTSKLETM